MRYFFVDGKVSCYEALRGLPGRLTEKPLHLYLCSAPSRHFVSRNYREKGNVWVRSSFRFVEAHVILGWDSPLMVCSVRIFGAATVHVAALYLVILKRQMTNILAGMRFYLVTTAWLTVRPGAATGVKKEI